MRRFASLAAFGVAISSASAQPKPATPALVGLKEVARFTTPVGFIDDPVAADEHHIAYVVADAASKAELHVVALGADAAEHVADLSIVTVHPIALALVGTRVFVVGANEDGSQIAALVEIAEHGKSKSGASTTGSTTPITPAIAPAAATVIYKLPAATHISVITRDGKRVIAVHRESSSHSGERHDVELVSLESGRRIASGRALELEADGTNKALDFRVNHWGDGMTRAFGIKGGDWDKKENQRTPDVEAAYDLITGKFTDRHPIPDLFEQRKRYQILADAGGRIDFLRIAPDGSAVQVWQAAKPRNIELDQPLASYDPKSLQGIVAPDGSAWFSIKVDPVNPDAVARKKADPEYLDVFHVGTDTKAIRKARVLAPKTRHWFGSIANDRFWLIERNTGFERGGRALVVYQLD